ncbi:hypothetical protein GF336_07005 [Candidatus Woesearchaeota archaeon]|nr:hypothetical protein [Candidatus Woesearchaeota archaeon]
MKNKTKKPRNRKTSKKAMILYYIVIPGFIIGLAYFFVATFYSSAIDPEQEKFDFTGKLSLIVLQAKEEAENTLLYIDQSASLAAQQALLDLSERGGSHSTSKMIDGHKIWNLGKQTDYPDYHEEFKKHFNSHFKNYLSAYPEQELSADIYDVSVSGDEILGLASEELKTPIFPDSKKIGGTEISYASIGRYIVKPDFKAKLRADLEQEFDSLIGDADSILINCRGSEDPEQCVKDNKPDHLKYTRGTADNFFLFNKTTSTMLLDKNMELKPLTYRFALFLPPK